MRPAVFLDRDGVLSETKIVDGQPRPPRSADELTIVAGAADSVARLRAQFTLVMVTNQPDIARGTANARDVEQINDAVRGAVGLDAVYCCPHDGADCPCRKPRPGMLLSAARDLDLDLSSSWLIGDRWVDIGAGTAAGVRSVLLERPYSWDRSGGATPSPSLRPAARVATLTEAIDFITTS